MQVYLVRHTEVEVPVGLCYGWHEVELKADYLKHFKKLKRQLPNNLEIIFTSPSTRCTKLARFIGNNIHQIPELRELNFGDWEGKLWQDIPESESKKWADNYITAPTPHGESTLDMYHRVTAFIDELRQQNHDNVVIVTHAGVIRCIMSYLLEIPLKNLFKIKIGHNKVYPLHLDIHDEYDSFEL
ncbi:alpha-ribazole phosphatase [Elizabethkingia sp. JS20170427COW]|uniref:alpha-ribazole phosphatase n=1 Tax=Elizabethkingia sp. JS20170427COW TaxID=2583851 RepID=UPI00143DA88E|nr:alpha-ribazole phosphatase [Elizabethkingia sp. JS20170427COW]